MIKRLVSVIIPIYNVKDYLDECIESVLKQTYRRIEILLVDDGSTDGSAQKCDEWAKLDSRIKVIHKKNGGLSSARNCGLDSSCGEYVYFLDSDDYIELNTIELLFNYANNDHLDIVLFNGECFWDQPQNNKIIKQYANIYKKSFSEILSGPEIFVKLKKKREYYPAVPMHFYNKEFLMKNGIRFMDGILHEDELFSILAYYHANRVGCCCEILYWRRMRNSSIMSSKINKKNVESCLLIINTIISEIEMGDKDNQIKKKMIRLGLAHCLWLYYLRFDLLESKEKKQLNTEKNKLNQKLRNEFYYKSTDIIKCCIKKILIPLRNNHVIHSLYRNLFS